MLVPSAAGSAFLTAKSLCCCDWVCAGCLKNVVVVWGGILQGDVVTVQELQARLVGGMEAVKCVCIAHSRRSPSTGTQA